ncbi:hypothetical protein EV426DRAFT_703274 [Tirmania nivea]|nr:hypothetical protein EV426DRAFT_703274 [Tirmania nivea]
MYYASNHLSSAKVLTEIAAAYRQRSYVGKTCSDQLVPDYYVEATKQSVAETEGILQWIRAYVLVGALEAARKDYDAFVQTHVAESVDEVMLGMFHPRGFGFMNNEGNAM